MLLLRSGARSSIIAFLSGFCVLYVFHRARLSKYSILAAVVAALALILSPGYWDQLNALVFKHAEQAPSDELSDRLLFSRQSAWDAHWEGFLERPILGWGFGIDKDSYFSEWEGEWGSTAVTGRDPVNDVMYALESGGIIGLLAYLYMTALIVKAWLPAPVRALLEVQLRRPGFGSVAMAYETYQVFFCLAALLIGMFQFDNTAFAAGNFFAALFWVSMGTALAFSARIVSALQQPAAEAQAQSTYPNAPFFRRRDRS
jgi:O-antigen ligase